MPNCRLLTIREAELFRRLVGQAIDLDRCNPDVGMGPTPETIATKLADSLSFDIDPDDIAEAAEEIKG